MPICVNCHDLKDRVPFDGWSVTAAAEFVMGLGTPAARIGVARLLADLYKLRREVETLKAADIRDAA